MAVSIIINNINLNIYSINKYIIQSIYISDKIKNKNIINIFIIKKIHLINELKIKMLIKINIISFKAINFNIINKTAYIKNYKVTI